MFSTPVVQVDPSPRKRDFTSAVNTLYSLQSNESLISAWAQTRRDPTVSIREQMLNYVGRLEIDLKKLNIIHVAGTKGKGSTCAFVESMLRQSGYQTGLYTSPHLVTVRERFKIRGELISEELFANHFWWCWEKFIKTSPNNNNNAEGLTPSELSQTCAMPPFFYFLTLLAFRVFIEEKVDVLVLEVGVGGRTDATNVFDQPSCCGVASIGYDHMAVLGETLGEIAWEKAGIFKKGVPAFISNNQQPSPFEVLKNRAFEIGAPFCVSPDLDQYVGHENIKLGLDGKFQNDNAALALALCNVYIASELLKGHSLPPALSNVHWTKEYDLSINNYSPKFFSPIPQPFLIGLSNVKWPGRAQKCKLAAYPNVTLYLDGAHTPESTAACSEWFNTTSKKDVDEKSQPIKLLVFTCRKGRDFDKLLDPIVSSKVIFTHSLVPTFILRDAIDPTEDPLSLYRGRGTYDPTWSNTVFEAVNSKGSTFGTVLKTDTINGSLDFIKHVASNNKDRSVQVLITGSLYLVGGILELLEYNIEA